MTINPADLPDGSPVHIRHLDGSESLVFKSGKGYVHNHDLVGKDDGFAFEGRTIVRTFSPDPLPSQEVPRDQWPNIRPGTRVHIVDTESGIHTGTLLDVKKRGCNSRMNAWSWREVARVFVLDEPADPDADLIERIAARMYEDENEGRVKWSDIPPTSSAIGVWKRYAATALAAVRESEDGAR